MQDVIEFEPKKGGGEVGAGEGNSRDGLQESRSYSLNEARAAARQQQSGDTVIQIFGNVEVTVESAPQCTDKPLPGIPGNKPGMKPDIKPEIKPWIKPESDGGSGTLKPEIRKPHLK